LAAANRYDSEFMKLRIKRLSAEARLPEYAHGPEEDAGMDLCALETVALPPNEPKLVSTGLSFEIPAGYEAQIRPRSGLALKHAITLPNSPATIDPGYRGEVRVILLNLGKNEYTVQKGDRIAQLVIAKYESIECEEGDLAGSIRGEGGFGSSGR
jgi:dUTP pyrophosphatase